MENLTQHECGRETRKEFLATVHQPYHFPDSGLSNVYLVGIRYFVCECGRKLAEIPAIKPLLMLISRDLIGKPTALAPEEIKFLRKRLGQKQSLFAKNIGVKAETLCRIENGKASTNERTDKLIRLYYVLASGDSVLTEALRTALKEMLSEWKADDAPAKIIATVNDNEWESDLVGTLNDSQHGSI
jgi:DNA-binding transcriptional regulator YiaG